MSTPDSEILTIGDLDYGDVSDNGSPLTGIMDATKPTREAPPNNVVPLR